MATNKILPMSGLPKGTEVIPECEISYEGGDDLERRHKRCTKNPGHTSFIPVSKFQMSHLPKEYQTQDIMNKLKDLCNLTVKIVIKYTSLDRPDTYADSNQPYPYGGKMRGSNRVIRYGTGFVRSLDLDGKKSHVQGERCPCLDCQKSDSPRLEYWTLLVATATHVIFDDSEAACAVIECFFDSNDKQGVKLMHGISLKSRSLEFNKHQSDMCYLNCVTHDRDVFTRLHELCCNYNCTFSMDAYLSPLAYIISHPHGCSKRITFGNMIHITAPLDSDHPVSTPIMFEEGTACRLPLYPWSWPETEDTAPPSGSGLSSDDTFPDNSGLSRDNTSPDDSGLSRDNTSPGDSGISRYNTFPGDSGLSRDSTSPSDSGLSRDNAPIHPSNSQSQIRSEKNPDEINPKEKENKEQQQSTTNVRTNNYCLPSPHDADVTKERNQNGSRRGIGPRPTEQVKQDHCHSNQERDLQLVNKTRDEHKDTGVTPTPLPSDTGVTPTPLPSDTGMTHTPLPSDTDDYSHLGATSLSFQEMLNVSSDKEFSSAQQQEDSADFLPQQIVDLDELTDQTFQPIPAFDFTSLFGKDAPPPPPGAVLVLSPELEHYLKSALSDSHPLEFSLQPGKQFDLPFGTTFTLPHTAKFAKRFARLKPAWFTLPPGSKLTLPDGKDVRLPAEAEFLSDRMSLRFSYVSYDMDTCPGSSGAIVHQEGVSMGLPFSVYNFSHFGALTDGNNRSGLQNLFLVL